MRKIIWIILAVSIISEMTYAKLIPAVSMTLSPLVFSQIKINFQPAASPIPTGYLPDSGLIFGDRGNGYSYGWDSAITKVYDRGDDVHPDNRYATTLYMERTSAPHGTWEIALDNDEYDLHIVCGDALYTNQINTVNVEGTILTDPDSADNFDEYNLTVTVFDGRLTVSAAAGMINAKICFLEITPVGLVNHTPIVFAGVDHSAVWPKNRLTMSGSISDDGKGNPDGFLGVTWTQISGPQGVIFNPGQDVIQTDITLPIPGIYTFELTATDGLLSASDSVVITILEPSCPVGDLTFDCKVDLTDLKLFADQWLSMDVPADFNDDTGVNLIDMAFVAQNWLSDWTSTIMTTLSPAGAVAAGALWRIDGGIWRSSGALVDSVMEGTHTIDFKPISGWIEPAGQSLISIRQQQYLLSGTYVEVPETTLILSEFMAINSNLYDLYPRPTLYSNNPNPTDDSDYPDWIEIRNTTAEAISLDGWFLTDDPDNLTKWKFPSGKQVNANGYFIVYASNKDPLRYPTNYPYVDTFGNPHTSFEMSGDGGYLALVKPDGKTIAHEYLDYPKQRGMMTYGIGNNNKTGFLKSVTRGAANDAAYDGEVADTQFSIDRGFYTQPISVAIVCGTPGATIRWTNDQSEPTLTNGNTYTGPIAISTTTCLRAAAFKDNHIPSNVDTHTYLYLNDVIKQATDPSTGAQVAPAGFPAIWPGGSSTGAVTGDYQMDPDICSPTGTFGSIYAGRILDDLKAVPTLSIVTSRDDLFGTSGIYIHEGQDGTERKASAELILPDGTEPGFQVNCGVRMQGGVTGGGTSLDRWKTYKCSMRLVFRGGYGPSQLRYTLFPDEREATDRFDTIVLEARLNNVWLHTDSGQRGRGEYTRDQFISDLQNRMGGYGAHGRPVHLYLNGLYWGLYWIHERPDDSFASAYLGGLEEDYDVLKHSVSGVVSGNNATFTQMVNVPVTDYARLQEYLDVPNFIDYMILNFYLGNSDWSHKNWYASHNHFDPSGRWRFHTWDAEHIMENPTENVTASDGASTPTGINEKWTANEEYRMLFADRVYQHMFNDGVLTPNNIRAYYQAIAAEVESAIVGESARWGDNRQATPHTRNIDWQNAYNFVLNTYLPGRRDVVIGQFRAKSPQWYPSIDPPIFKIDGQPQHGGNAASGASLSMTNPNTVTTESVELVSEGALVRAFVPSDNTLGITWTTKTFTPGAGWTDGSTGTGVGYDRSTPYDALILTNLESAMYNKQSSVYCRIPFAVTNSSDIITLKLHMKYDDGFIAYLNGSEVCRSGNITNSVPPSAACGDHAAGSYVEYDISSYQTLLS
ncbi:MAG: hypothetical protein GX455_16965, partial [Phycisphaerae bacterium]|nr:hypothetical protein [Phycisphaerae bacterium]